MALEVTSRGSGDGLGLPRVPLGFVPAPGVSQILSALPPIVVFRAPRGFGKTSTASYWLRRADAPDHDRIWVNVPNRPIDREEFWTLMHRRVQDAGLGDLEGADSWDDVEHRMYGRGRHLVIAIDSFHHVTDTAVDEELISLVTNHESLHLIVMMRAARPIETLASSAADGVVFRAVDLALGPREVAQLGEATGRPISEEEAERLCAELVGWPAMIRAVLLETTRGPTGQLLVDWSAVERYCRLVLGDADTTGYFEAVMALAVPTEFTREIAELLLGAEVVDRTFTRVRNAGILTVTVVDGRSAYRYPPSIREAIQRIFREQDRPGYLKVNRTMAAWYRGRGQPERVLDHAVRGEDWEQTAQVVEAYWVELISGFPEQVRDALAHLPTSIIRGSARLLVARDYILNVDTDERSLTAMRTGLLEADSDFSRRDDVRLSLGQVLALRSTGQYEIAREIVERQRVDLLADVGEWTEDVLAEMPELLLQWSITRLFTADTVGAAYAFREAYRWARERHMVEAEREAGSGLALSLAILGHLPAAERWLTRIESLPLPPAATPTVLETVSVRLVRDMMDLDTLQFANESSSSDLDLPAGLGDLRAVALQLQAGRVMHGGSRFEMIGLLETYRQERISAHHGPGLAENVIITSLVDLCIATAQSDRARTLLSRTHDGGTRSRMSRARHALFAGEYEEALRLTDGAAAHAGTRPRVTLHLTLIRACASHRLQLVDRAADALHLAISISEQSGLLRPFLLVPRTDLEQIAAAMPQAAEFLSRPEIADSPELLPAPYEAVKLSERELRVLTEIAPGLSLNHAARRLYVSENTIKTQMRNIYRKLGVHTREDAVERARELGLLDQDAPDGSR
ncbi:MAG: hypothetical protein JJE50_00485 [Actinomycetales bacterium]|nr:hypothetical protein [Actinomycetales bacterium]